mgnify:CR=1 FL=1
MKDQATLLKKLRWIEHPESSSLVQLQFNNCGMWYTLDGTTTHTLADAVKYCIMDDYCKSFFGLSLEDIKNNHL